MRWIPWVGGAIVTALLLTSKEAVAYVNGKPTGKIDLITIDGEQVERQTGMQFRAMQQAAAKDGINLTISSGFRTMEEQQVLYALYLGKIAKNGDTGAASKFAKLRVSVAASLRPALDTAFKKADGNLAATPGFSNHQNGVAVDIGVRSSFSSPEYLWLAKNASRFGFTNTGKDFPQPEPWHWERTRIVPIVVS
jgi:LAS superfamily LD-carboxypeptidase LdcB